MTEISPYTPDTTESEERRRRRSAVWFRGRTLAAATVIAAAGVGVTLAAFTDSGIVQFDDVTASSADVDLRFNGAEGNPDAVVLTWDQDAATSGALLPGETLTASLDVTNEGGAAAAVVVTADQAGAAVEGLEISINGAAAVPLGELSIDDFTIAGDGSETVSYDFVVTATNNLPQGQATNGITLQFDAEAVR
jgi:hypothetical protein